jgi:hypothetical protein
MTHHSIHPMTTKPITKTIINHWNHHTKLTHHVEFSQTRRSTSHNRCPRTARTANTCNWKQIIYCRAKSFEGDWKAPRCHQKSCRFCPIIKHKNKKNRKKHIQNVNDNALYIRMNHEHNRMSETRITHLLSTYLSLIQFYLHAIEPNSAAANVYLQQLIVPFASIYFSRRNVAQWLFVRIRRPSWINKWMTSVTIKK